MSKKKPLEIDMIAGSQLRDTQGEMLSVEGADISDLIAGRGRFNDNHGKGFYNSIGRVTGAKKIFKSEDCENDRQLYYWDKVKAPFIYVSGYLYDDEDHPNARAAAAILRNVHKSDAALKIKASVEGGVISRGVSDPSLLARTKIHSVALTFTPANNATLVEPTSMDKSSYDEVADAELIKSVIHLAETNVPSFRHITRHASASRILNNIETIKELAAELGIPEDSIPLPNKNELIKQAVEHKIYENVKKINQLVQELSKSDQLYHIHIGGERVTDKPVTLTQVNNMYGGVKRLEASGHVLVPHEEINKALMAGYGGAGAPTSMSGGSVLQSEALDDGRKMKFIGCDDCGKEQIYAKHQVKCRHCNKSFPLEKLYGLITSK